MATSSKSRDNFVRTLKFPLQLQGISQIDFGKISDLYGTTEGTHDASLFGLLMSVHLTGFRLFGNSTQAKAFQFSRDLDTEFREKWKTQIVDEAPNLSPSVLISFVKKVPRRRNEGELPLFEESVIMERLGAETKYKPPENTSTEGVTTGQILKAFSSGLAREFSDWSNMKEDRGRAAIRIFDAVAASLGVNLPSVEAGINKMEQSDSSFHPAIAYDPGLLTIDIEDFSEFAIHQVVAQKLHMLRRDSKDPENINQSDLQQQITTQSNNALSWIFGEGFLYWRKKSTEEICSDFSISDENKGEIEKLKELFSRIPEDKVFGALRYSNYRSSLGGKVDSWVANYFGQLKELEERIEKIGDQWSIPNELKQPENKELLSSAGLSAGQIENLIQGLSSELPQIKEALSCLLGRKDKLPSEKDVNRIMKFSSKLDGISGVLRSIKNQLEQEKESDDSDRVSVADTCDFKLPKWLEKLPKINQISGGVPDIKREIEELKNSFTQLRRLYADSVGETLDNAGKKGFLSDPLKHFIEIEKRELSKRGGNTSSAEEQALKKLVHGFARLAVTGSDEFKELVKPTLYQLYSKRDVNRFIHNAQGAIYRSPFSRSRHQAYSVDNTKLKALKIGDRIEEIIMGLRSELKKSSSFALYRDLLRAENFLYRYRLTGLLDEVPKDIVPVEKIIPHIFLPMYMEHLLSLDELKRETVIKLFNQLNSELNGAIARAFRESFFVKTKFMRVRENELLWVAKQKPWLPPKHVEESSSKLGESIQNVRSQLNQPQGALDPIKVVEVTTQERSEDEHIAPLLQQMPHDWYVDLKVVQVTSDREIKGIGVGKKKIKRNFQTAESPARLIGPPSFKTLIDQWLSNPNIKLGEHNLMFIQKYTQKVELLSDFSPKISIEPKQLTAEIALVVTDERDYRSDANPIAQSVIGIDLGEAGIGYAVFRVDDIKAAVKNGSFPDPIKAGAVPIPSVRNLIKNVRRYRKKTQPNQRFLQKSNTMLMQLRENAVGNTCFVIDGLCAKYKGLPVLESSIANLASGGKQLELVYDKVVHSYCYSDIDAHKQARKHHWAGAENWEHPKLMERERKKEENHGRWEPIGPPRALKHYPGASVHPYRTSQTCSSCKRNPYYVVEQTSQLKYSIQDGGRVVLDDEHVLLLKQQDKPNGKKEEVDREMKKYRRRKERAPFQYPFQPSREGKEVDQEELKRIIKRQLRQAPKSSRSKDTTQSEYHCVFEDCQNQMHADKNAAINIVRKWIKDKGIH